MPAGPASLADPSPAAHEPNNPGLVWYEPSHGWNTLDFPELWRYRDLLGILAMRDLQIRYRQTAVGVAWAVVQPVAQMLVFTLVLGWMEARTSTSGSPHFLIAWSGLALWQAFSHVVQQSTASLSGNQNLITKVHFPRLILPLSTVLTALVDAAISIALLSIAVAVWGPGLRPALLWTPVWIALSVAAGVGLGLWLSAANALFRDVGYVVPLMLQIGFWMSPVVYESGVLPAGPRQWLAINPLSVAIEGFRWSLFGSSFPPLFALMASLIAIAVLGFGGLAFFRSVERTLADRV